MENVKVKRKAVVTLDDDSKVTMELIISLKNLMSYSEFEDRFVREWNNAQPKMVHKVVKCHLVRN